MSQKQKIFIADDEADILEILQLMLTVHGYDVTVSTDPSIIFDDDNRKDLPDLFLLDIWMNGVDGRDICRQIKDDPNMQQVPVIFVSANSNIADISTECQAEGFIAKPFEMSQLVKVIRQVLPVKQ